MSGIAGEEIDPGDPVYQGTDGKWYRANKAWWEGLTATVMITSFQCVCRDGETVKLARVDEDPSPCAIAMGNFLPGHVFGRNDCTFSTADLKIAPTRIVGPYVDADTPQIVHAAR